jgi:hypothetical protein
LPAWQRQIRCLPDWLVEKAEFEFVTEFLKEEVKYVFWQGLFPEK